MIATCSATGTGWRSPWLSVCTSRLPRASVRCVSSSRSDPNDANASRSRNCDSSPFIRPATLRSGPIWAEPPTRDTEMPTLIAGRAAQEERHLPVRVRVLGEVVVDRQRVLALPEEVLADRRARVRGEELDRRGLVGGGGDDDRVVHRARVLERLRDADHGRHALPDRDVDRDDAGVLVVDDRVY